MIYKCTNVHCCYGLDAEEGRITLRDENWRIPENRRANSMSQTLENRKEHEGLCIDCYQDRINDKHEFSKEG